MYRRVHKHRACFIFKLITKNNVGIYGIFIPFTIQRQNIMVLIDNINKQHHNYYSTPTIFLTSHVKEFDFLLLHYNSLIFLLNFCTHETFKINIVNLDYSS